MQTFPQQSAERTEDTSRKSLTSSAACKDVGLESLPCAGCKGNMDH